MGLKPRNNNKKSDKIDVSDTAINSSESKKNNTYDNSESKGDDITCLDIVDINSKVNQKILTNLSKKSMKKEYSEKYSFYMMTTLSNFTNLLIPVDVCNRSGMYLHIRNGKLFSTSVDPANALIVKTWIELKELVSYMFDTTKTTEFSVFMNEKENASSILSTLGIDSNIEIYIRRDRPEHLVFENNGFILKFGLMAFTDGDIIASKKIADANIEQLISKNELIINASKFLLFNAVISKKINSEEKKNIVYALYKNKEDCVIFAIMGENSIYLTDNKFDFSRLDNEVGITAIKKFEESELKSNNLVNDSITRVGISYTNLFKNIIKSSEDIKLSIGFDSLLSLNGDNISVILANVPIESDD